MYKHRYLFVVLFFFFFSSRRRHTRFDCDWSSDVCSSDLRKRDRERGEGSAFFFSASCPQSPALVPRSPLSVLRSRFLHPPQQPNLPRVINKIGRASCRERV